VREVAPAIADESEREALALQACVQLFTLGWRMGGSEAESAAIFDEGRALAERRGDRHALARLFALYGLIRNQLTGSALEYVRYSEEGAAIAAESDDPALRAAIGTFPAYAHYFAGNGRAMLDWSERVLAEVGSDDALGKQYAGYGPRAAMFNLRTFGLLSLGRFEEAWNTARAAEQVAKDSRELEVLTWVLFSRAALAYACGGPESGLEGARHCLAIAEEIDNESSRMLACTSLGYAHLVDAQPAAAREALLQSVAIAREHRSQLSTVPMSLALLSEAHRALGEHAAALVAAREGVELASSGGGRYFEAQARLALVAALLGTGGTPPRAEIEAELARAEELVESISARSLSPRILELRGRVANALGDGSACDRALREALDLFREIGAAGHAERLARELAS
jgi:tetratricopeptide (TPR) repeat protein